MAQQAPSRTKIPTVSPQLARGHAAKQPKLSRRTPVRVLASGTDRAATRGGAPVIELEHGITVYPAREEQGRWRAVWQEDGKRQQCEAASEEKLTAKLEKVAVRLEADAPNMTLRGVDLIAFYLSQDRTVRLARKANRDADQTPSHADRSGRACYRPTLPTAYSACAWVNPAP